MMEISMKSVEKALDYWGINEFEFNNILIIIDLN